MWQKLLAIYEFISLQHGIIYLYNYKDCLFYMLNHLVLCIDDLSEILKYIKFINDDIRSTYKLSLMLFENFQFIQRLYISNIGDHACTKVYVYSR